MDRVQEKCSPASSRIHLLKWPWFVSEKPSEGTYCPSMTSTEPSGARTLQNSANSKTKIIIFLQSEGFANKPIQSNVLWHLSTAEGSEDNICRREGWWERRTCQQTHTRVQTHTIPCFLHDVNMPQDHVVVKPGSHAVLFLQSLTRVGQWWQVSPMCTCRAQDSANFGKEDSAICKHRRQLSSIPHPPGPSSPDSDTITTLLTHSFATSGLLPFA